MEVLFAANALLISSRAVTARERASWKLSGAGEDLGGSSHGMKPVSDLCKWNCLSEQSQHTSLRAAKEAAIKLTPACDFLGDSTRPPYLDRVVMEGLQHSQSFRGAPPLGLCSDHDIREVCGRDVISCPQCADAQAVYSPSAARETKL